MAEPKDETSLILSQNKTGAIWFTDPHCTSDKTDVRNVTKELEGIVGSLRIFDRVDTCLDCLEQMKILPMILVIHESNGASILSQIVHKNFKLRLVYILCSDLSNYPVWATVCKSMRCYPIQPTSLCDRVRMDVTAQDAAFDVVDSSFDASTATENRNKQDVMFMYTQLLHYVLTGMSYSDGDCQKMIDFFMDRYKVSPFAVKEIGEFSMEYQTKGAIWCYTRYAFLYQTLNAALRRSDIDGLIKMGMFIRDLHQEIVEIYRLDGQPQIGKLYRGQVIRRDIFEKIEKNMGGLLSMKEFLSTSTDKEAASTFVDGFDVNNVGVLFEIVIGQTVPSDTFYANIQHRSHFPDEREYLFSGGSVFRIESIEKLDVNATYRVHLSLTSEHDSQLSQLRQFMRSIIPQRDTFGLMMVLYQLSAWKQVIEVAELIHTQNPEQWQLCGVNFMATIARYMMGQSDLCMAQNKKEIHDIEELSVGAEDDLLLLLEFSRLPLVHVQVPSTWILGEKAKYLQSTDPVNSSTYVLKYL